MPICVATLALAAASRMRAGLPDVVRQRLLAVDVLAVPQGQHGGEGVRVLAGADDDGVELALVVEEPAEVGDLAAPWGTWPPAASTARSIRRRTGRRCSRR